MYVFRELTDLSYPAIAREFGGRDHTTVIHAVEKIQRLMKERQQIYDQVTELVQRIQSGSVSRQMTSMWSGLWTTLCHPVDNDERLSTRGPSMRPATCGSLGTASGQHEGAVDLHRHRDRSTIHSPYYHYYLFNEP